tara:strand:- start:13684 stop:14271 length:588 start_codon:yes stop_codon:yes gene_type:complete
LITFVLDHESVVQIPDAVRVEPSLLLRIARLEDAKELYSLVEKNRVYLREWLPWLDDAESIEDEIDFIKDQQKRASLKKGCLFLIELENDIVGTVSLNSIDLGNLTGWIGYWLDKDHSGRGIMTKSVAAIVDVLLVSCGFNRIVIEVGENNPSSLAIPKRMGFRNEGTSLERLWMYDRWVNSTQFAITASEWEKK